MATAYRPDAVEGSSSSAADSAAAGSAFVREWAELGLVNILGGCCGSSPAHIAAIAKAVAGIAPRRVPGCPGGTRLAGLEPMTIAA